MYLILKAAATAVIVVTVLSGCSSGPKITLDSSGTIPPGGTYSLIEGIPGNIGQSVSDSLTRRGLIASESPDYIVQVSYAERPAGIGVLIPDNGHRRWLQPPDFHRKKRPVATLGINIVDVADGQEIYHASASGPLSSKGDERATLLQAIFPDPVQN